MRFRAPLSLGRGAFTAAAVLLALLAAAAATLDTGEYVFPKPRFQECLNSIVQRFSGEQHVAPPTVVFRGDAGYAAATSNWNVRLRPQPLALFYAQRTAHVKAAVKCGRQFGVPVSPAGGRHSFLGAALVTDGLTIDMSNLTRISLDSDKGILTVGAGVVNSMVVAALRRKGPPGAVFPTGDCPWVGIAGYSLGGGIGMLSRYLGLGCDQLLGLTMVDANGEVVQASKTNHSDLLWASCGGGGGTFGIVAEFQFKLRVLPNDGSVTVVRVQYGKGLNTTVDAFMKYQEWFPTMDRRMGGMIKWEDKAMRLEFVFIGSPDEAVDQLRKAGMLDLPIQYADFVPAPSYFNYVKYFVEHEWLAADIDALPADADVDDFVLRTMRGEEGYRVLPGSKPAWVYSKNRVVKFLPQKAVKALAEYILAVQDALADTPFHAMAHFWVLGGAIADVAPRDTAFYHRTARAVMAVETYTDASFANATVDEQAMVVRQVNMAVKLVDPFLRPRRYQYANYLNPQERGWKLGMWGPNYYRLADIKRKYDPTDVFGKTNTVVPAQ